MITVEDASVYVVYKDVAVLCRRSSRTRNICWNSRTWVQWLTTAITHVSCLIVSEKYVPLFSCLLEVCSAMIASHVVVVFRPKFFGTTSNCM